MDLGQAFLNLLQKLFGTGINIPALVVGIIIAGTGAFLIQREHTSQHEKPGVIARVVSVLLSGLGVFTILASIGVDSTDALLVGWILVFIGGIWMVTARHGLTTLLGLILAVLGVAFVWIIVANTPQGSGSFLTDGFRSMISLFSNATHKQ